MTLRRGSSRYNLIYNQAAKLPLKYLRCRAVGHLWGGIEKEALNLSTWRLFSQCASCESEKRWDWSIRGVRIAPPATYYSDGYLMTETGILETADRDIVRMIFLQRLEEEGFEDS